MDEQQALAEARQRWGAAGAVQYNETFRGLPYCVGIQVLGIITCRGQGTSWEAAFKNANERRATASRLSVLDQVHERFVSERLDDGRVRLTCRVCDKAATLRGEAAAASLQNQIDKHRHGAPETAGTAVANHQPTPAQPAREDSTTMSTSAVAATKSKQSLAKANAAAGKGPKAPPAKAKSERAAIKEMQAVIAKTTKRERAKAKESAKIEKGVTQGMEAAVPERATRARLGEIHGVSPTAFLRYLGSIGFKPLEAQAYCATFGVTVARGTAGIQTSAGRIGEKSGRGEVPAMTGAIRKEALAWRKTFEPAVKVTGDDDSEE